MSSEHYVWAVDGKPLTVYLGAAAVAKLESHLSGGSEERGTEVGGFLLGRVSEEHGSWLVSVEDIDVAICEHARGPSWTLSRTDRETFERQMTRLSKRGVVGWFRTHTRPGLYLDQHDFALFRELFAHPSAVALAVRPDGEAGFFFWEDGDIERSRPYRTFICRRKALHFDSQPAVSAGPAKVHVAQVSSANKHRGFRRELLWIPAAAGIALAAFWSPSPFEAERGRAEGPETPGRPVFSPPPEKPAASAAVEQNVAAPAPDPPAELPPAQETAQAQDNPPVAAAPREPVLSPPQTAGQTTAPAAASVPAPPPPVSTPPVPAPEPPAAIATAKPAPPPPPASASRPKEALASTPVAPSKTMASMTPPVETVPAMSQLAGLDAPPKVSRQVKPVHFDVSYPVQVKVKIGRDGYVKSAYLLTTSASAATASSVMRAARGYRFTPARRANQTVESEMVLTFQPQQGEGTI